MSRGPAGPGSADADGPGLAGAGGKDEAAALEYGRWLFAQECNFILGAASADGLPPPDHEEIAFAGRSNVGKSSLLNALTGRKSLARVSHTPGRTRQLNFFLLGERLMLADLPGYGYARAPKGEIENWTDLIHAYLRGRPNLRRLCLLIDGRHGPKDSDRGIMDLLDTDAVPYQVVLTKIDKTRPAERAGVLDALVAELKIRPAAHPEVMQTSAREGTGIAGLRAGLAALVPPGRFG